MANTYTLIASNTLSSAAASVTFSSIPQTYTDLVLRVSTRTDGSADNTLLGVRFNNDTNTNYSSILLTGNGSTASSSTLGTFANTYLGQTVANTATANTFNNGELYVPNYTASQNKPISGIGIAENNSTTAIIRAVAGLWQVTSAITSITLISGNGNFMTGSSFFLYGIKNS